MTCSNCEKETRVVREDESHNSETNAIYKRTVAECEHCGTWVTTEIPKL